MTTKTDEWRSLAGDFDMPACHALSSACDAIEQLEARLALAESKSADFPWAEFVKRHGTILRLEDELKLFKGRLALAEKVCQSAEWVIQDPTLSHTDCSSEPWEQSHDSRDRLADDVKSWREARAELAELNEWDIHALKERDDLREKLAIAVEALKESILVMGNEQFYWERTKAVREALAKIGDRK